MRNAHPVSTVKTPPVVAAVKGFTLVELVVVMILIGIVAAIGSTKFFDKQTFDEYGFLNETLSAVRYAQKLAVASGCVVRVNINSNAYHLYRAAIPANCSVTPYTAATYGTDVKDPADPNRNFTNTAPSGLGLSSTAADFYFVPLGNLGSPAGNVIVTVGGKTFTVWAVTGFVEPPP